MPVTAPGLSYGTRGGADGFTVRPIQPGGWAGYGTSRPPAGALWPAVMIAPGIAGVSGDVPGASIACCGAEIARAGLATDRVARGGPYCFSNRRGLASHRVKAA